MQDYVGIQTFQLLARKVTTTKTVVPSCEISFMLQMYTCQLQMLPTEEL